MKQNKEADNDWFKLESNAEGTKWFGTCWTFVDGLKYEFDVEFDVSGRVAAGGWLRRMLSRGCDTASPNARPPPLCSV